VRFLILQKKIIPVYININKQTTSTHKTHATFWKHATAPRKTNDQPIAKGWQERYARRLF
jgi:hypothetical protein